MRKRLGILLAAVALFGAGYAVGGMATQPPTGSPVLDRALSRGKYLWSNGSEVATDKSLDEKLGSLRRDIGWDIESALYTVEVNLAAEIAALPCN